MSPWWREEISIELAPVRALLVRRSRGLRRHELARVTLEAQPAGAPAWREIVAALNAYLMSHKWRRASLRFQLRGSLVRYVVLPPAGQLAHCDALTYAQQSFAEMHGEIAHGWSVCVDRAAHGGVYVAAAVDSGLIEALQDVARGLDSHIVAVTPLLEGAVRMLANIDRTFSGWLALVDFGHSCIARFDCGECRSIRTARFAESAERHLIAQLEQDALCAGLDGAAGKLFVHSAAPIDHASLTSYGWHSSPLIVGSGA